MRIGYGICFGEKKNKEDKYEDKYEDRYCTICGTKMTASDYYGFTSWSGAMANSKHQCVEYKCPNLKKEWHEKAVSISLEVEATSSPSLKKILIGDRYDIVTNGLRK
jgi:hypothetical protein